MSGGYKRKHESGIEKRKKKEEKDEALKKIKGSSLALLSIENDLMREMTFEDVISDFANAKSRKVNII